MTATNVPELKQIEIDTIRMIARGYSNEDIATAQEAPLMTVKSRVRRIHLLLGTSAGPEQRVQGRVKITIWAYEHGLVVPAAQPAKLSDLLVEQLLDYAEAAYRNQPRGDLRKLAAAALRTAGRLPAMHKRRPHTAPPA